MLQTVLYDGSFEGLLCAIFDVFDYKFTDVVICRCDRFGGNLFERVHNTRMEASHSARVWTGLGRRLSPEGRAQLYRCYLSEMDDIENVLLRFAQYVFRSPGNIEQDFGNEDVLTVSQVAHKVWKEQHRMEAFVRFQKTGDGLFYALIEPDHDVLPLIEKHFTGRYADQRWVIYDGRRKYGIYYDGLRTNTVAIQFESELQGGKEVAAAYDAEEAFYQQLWRQYFKSVNIPARKNLKLQLQHMPRRYWKYLVEKGGGC